MDGRDRHLGLLLLLSQIQNNRNWVRNTEAETQNSTFRGAGVANGGLTGCTAVLTPSLNVEIMHNYVGSGTLGQCCVGS